MTEKEQLQKTQTQSALPKEANPPKFKSEQFGPIEAVEYFSFMSQYVPVVKTTLKGSREACRAIDRMEAINAKKTSDEFRARLAMEPNSPGTPPSSPTTPPHEGERKVKDASDLTPPKPGHV